jgi:PhzF family phenazine biosynthesis protein
VTIPFYLVDAFAEAPFTGNPAGVCLLSAQAPEDWMQKVAMEMNQAETAFVFPTGHEFSLRWFTPTSEVDLCGHATLASAKVLWESGLLELEKEAIFQTKSGELRCRLQGGQIAMDFPAEPAQPEDIPESLIGAFEGTPIWYGRNRMDVLIQLLDYDEVLNLQPSSNMLASIPTRGFIFTAQSKDPQYDFISRFFAPGVGVEEDAVTGSAHCCLAPFWAPKLGKADLVGYQASPRGGVVGMSLNGNRVLLSGKAQVVVKGELLA